LVNFLDTDEAGKLAPIGVVSFLWSGVEQIDSKYNLTE